MRSPSRRRSAPLAVAVLVLAVLAGGCAQVVPGLPTAAPAVSGAAARPLSTDEVARLAAGALQILWRVQFPAAFDGSSWTDVARFSPVHSADSGAPAPPCAARAAELAGQAFYCPALDAVVWDADGLLPELRNRFGPPGVVVVLAHEVGHAVQSRLGVDQAQARDPARYPTILLEAMADCYAGVALAHLAAHPVPGLLLGPLERDDALLALVGFRDPLGVEPGDVSAHGNAFDRVSAFQDGYVHGARRCAGMSLDNRAFTQRRFGSAADRARGGDLPLPELLGAVETDARGWFTDLVPGWRAPALTDGSGCAGPAQAAQGPARFCAADGSISVEPDELAALHRQFGDYAAAALLVSRYGMAALAAGGAEPTGPAAGAAAVCLTGAYSGRLLALGDGFSLSPGDLDEAVQVLLAGDWAARDAAGQADPDEHGFDRVGRFRTGLLKGPAACLPG